MTYISSDIKAVLFDHDDTLVGTIEAKWAAHKHIAQTHYGKMLTDDDIRPHWGKPLRTMVGLLYGDDDLDRAVAREAATHDQFPKRLFEDTVRVLKHLHESGRKLGLITATTRQSLEHDLRTLGIPREYFDYLQTQDDTPLHKPDPGVFEPAKQWLAGAGIRPEEVVYVGDGLHDMKAALGAGFAFVGVGTGLVTPAEFESAGSRAVQRLGDLV